MARMRTVVEDDTLSALTERFYRDTTHFPLIATASGIPNPDLISVGQVCRMQLLTRHSYRGSCPDSQSVQRTTSSHFSLLRRHLSRWPSA